MRSPPCRCMHDLSDGRNIFTANFKILKWCTVIQCVISGIHHAVEEICALLGYYRAHSGNSLPMFRNTDQPNLQEWRNPIKEYQEKYSWIFWPLKTGPIGFPEMSVRNYHCTLHNIPEEAYLLWHNFKKHETT